MFFSSQGGGAGPRALPLGAPLAGTIPLSTVHPNSFLYLMLFCETHDLVWEIISVSEKRLKNCIVKTIDNVFEKMKVGSFL